jgi:queuosine precursor transporter
MNKNQRTPENKLSSIFFIIGALFVTCLLISNIIAGKIISIWYWSVPAAIVIFPITYLFGDVLTEVYGFKKARLVIWTGFIMNFFMVLVFWLAIVLKYPVFWKDQASYSTVLGMTPRIVLASLIAYLFGEFINSTILSIMKKGTKGRWLWTRTIGSTIFGQGIDSLIFITIAFAYVFSWNIVFQMVLVQWIIKTLYEIIATPATYAIVHYIKIKEGLDTFDYGVRYNPFGRK